ncbi:MAG: class I SAM-dependent methyltransferase [Chloroflexi bacterium]|nr:class I SAM-dependent methyltransferase [Chloroflexota bacterium]
MRFLARFAAELADGAEVLELGCGAGVPATARLSQRFRVTGVDVSAAQIERARSLVPSATLMVADIGELDLADGSFDGVAAFYVLGHVQRKRLDTLLGRIASWLRPGGWFVASFGVADEDGWTGDWLGVPMFFSSFPPARNRELVVAAGLAIVADELVTAAEDGSAVTFQWILACRS